jgi:hypothetical protein
VVGPAPVRLQRLGSVGQSQNHKLSCGVSALSPCLSSLLRQHKLTRGSSNSIVLIVNMTSWREEYIEALKGRDKREKLDYELIDACG